MSEPLITTALETLRVLVIDNDHASFEVLEAIPKTAHCREAVVRAALEPDVSGHVREPMSKDSLMKAIHRAINRTPDLKPPGDYAASVCPRRAD